MVVPWKAWLEGHAFDLDTLGQLFREGDPLVAKDPADGYYLESSAIEGAGGQPDSMAVEALVKRINGVARANDQDFRPVRLQGRYTAPDGGVCIAPPTARVEIREKATVLKVGVPVLDAPPKGPRYVRLAERDPDVADMLRILGQPERLDWYDIYKAWEILEHAVGGRRNVEARDWASKADIDRLTASANHPGISGDGARHARMEGTPGPSRFMPMREADALMRQLAANWIESHPSY